ncbi:hypothetical protein HK098_007617 [Nowakowskiella sp. JEL0407]|nr:hypothetical protein HK098_007617 [Nowakowskiella sp. JEL0407]
MIITNLSRLRISVERAKQNSARKRKKLALGGFKVVSDYEEERDAMESFLKFRICKGIVNGWRKEDPNGNAVDRIALDNIRDDHLEMDNIVCGIINLQCCE